MLRFPTNSLTALQSVMSLAVTLREAIEAQFMLRYKTEKWSDLLFAFDRRSFELRLAGARLVHDVNTSFVKIGLKNIVRILPTDSADNDVASGGTAWLILET